MKTLGQIHTHLDGPLCHPGAERERKVDPCHPSWLRCCPANCHHAGCKSTVPYEVVAVLDQRLVVSRPLLPRICRPVAFGKLSSSSGLNERTGIRDNCARDESLTFPRQMLVVRRMLGQQLERRPRERDVAPRDTKLPRRFHKRVLMHSPILQGFELNSWRAPTAGRRTGPSQALKSDPALAAISS
jgi:hypothetical protein